MTRHAIAKSWTGAVLVLACLVMAGPAAAGAAKPSGGDEGEGGFMKLDPLQVTVVHQLFPRGVLIVDLGLRVPDSKQRAALRGSLPRLRDHMLRFLTSYSASRISFSRPVEVHRLAGRLQAIADGYALEGLGDKAIEVLMVNVTLHRR